MSQAKELLERAADLINTYGHKKGYFGTQRTGYCMMGALAVVANASTEGCWICDVIPAIRWSAGLGVRAEADNAIDLIKWNDAPGTTKEDVVNALRKAVRYV